MALFKGDAVKHVNKVLDKVEKRREKLTERVALLREEEKALREAVQDDFNQAILNDREPTKKLSTDLEKVREELKQSEFQLDQLDAVLESELAKQRDAVHKERLQFVQDKGEEFNKLFDEMNELKLAYLNKIMEYRQKHLEYDREYWNTFREIEKRVGLAGRDPRSDFELFLYQKHQISGRILHLFTWTNYAGRLLKGNYPIKQRLTRTHLKRRRNKIHSLILVIKKGMAENRAVGSSSFY